MNLKALAAALALALSPSLALAANPPELIGDWKGVLEVEGNKLTLIWHVSQDKVTVDVPEQASMNLPGEAGVNGSNLTLGIPMVGANFEGKLSADGKRLDGAFYQGGVSPTLILDKTSSTPTFAAGPKPAPAEIRGEWEGSVQSPNGPVVIAYHLSENPTADIAAANAKGVPAIVDKTADGYRVNVLGAVFEGKLAADGKSMTGTITQAGQGGAMTLTRK